MTITNGYATLAEVKARLDIDPSDTTDDTPLEQVIEGVSRAIDAYCNGRTFYARSETRYYSVPEGREIKLDDDLLTITTLTNGDGTVLTENTDFYTWPRNISPKKKVIMKEMSSYYWLYDSSGNTEYVISIEGTWGWSSTAPTNVAEACRLQSERLFMRKDAIFGIVGSANMGQMRIIPDLDPDVKMMLNPYVRRV